MERGGFRLIIKPPIPTICMIISIDTDGFSPDSGLIVIGLRTPSEVRLWKRWAFQDEKAMLSDFIKHFLSVTDDKIIIGFNLLKFDLPILLHKAACLPEFGEFFRKVNSSNVIDLFTILTFLNKGQLSGLEFYCNALGIRNLGPKRDEVSRLYKSGISTDLEKISELASLKLNTISELFLKSWGQVKDGQHMLWGASNKKDGGA